MKTHKSSIAMVGLTHKRGYGVQWTLCRLPQWQSLVYALDQSTFGRSCDLGMSSILQDHAGSHDSFTFSKRQGHISCTIHHCLPIKWWCVCHMQLQ